jgi:hypothetical protein
VSQPQNSALDREVGQTDERPRVGLLYYAIGTAETDVYLFRNTGGAEPFRLGSNDQIFPRVDELIAAMEGEYARTHVR